MANGRRIAFRANHLEVATIDNLAKIFPDKAGTPSTSDAMHFIVSFFIWQSTMYPKESKQIIASLYDMMRETPLRSDS